MDNREDLEKLKLEIAMFNATNEIEKKSRNYLQKNNEKMRINLIKRKVIATVCASFVLVSGIVVATNIKNKDRGLGGGIETAVENGYIEKANVQFINANDIGLNVTLEDFLMDDTNLSANLIFEFENSLNETVNLEDIYEIELKDLIIRDEENRILYGGNDEERFKNYCTQNNLNYKYGEFNENYMNSGVGCFIESKGYNNINLLYNMYSDNFPRSQKLYFSFTKLSIAEKEGRKVIINGNWKVSVDVPEKMYNRTEEYYKVVSCDNDDFEVYTAKTTETGFEFGVIISNIEKPEFEIEEMKKWQTADEDYKNKKISEEEYDKLINESREYLYLNTPISLSNYKINNKQLQMSYVENENGQKYECTFSPSRRSRGKFLEKNKYDFYETFSMTKYNATDKIKVVLYYYGELVHIELEK